MTWKKPKICFNRKTSPSKELLCYCFKIYKEEIVSLILERRPKTVEDVQQYCRASMGCGGCRPDIEDLIEELI